MYKRKPRPTSFSHADRLCDQLRVEQQQNNLLAAKLFLETSLNTKLCEDLHKELQDGIILCRLINCMKPGTISTIGRKNIPFVKMANISLFLQGAKDLGLQNSDLFQTVDLYEAKDMAAVINTILTFARICNKDGKPTVPFDQNQEYSSQEKQQLNQLLAQSTHRHVKNIFEHQKQQHLSPDFIGYQQSLSAKNLNNVKTGVMDTNVEELQQTNRHLPQKPSPGTDFNKQQSPMTNDSGYGSITRQRQVSNSTPTQIMDALFDDENEGDVYDLFDGGIGSMPKQHAPSRLQVHGGPYIIRKRFSQTSLNMDSSSPPSPSPPMPQRPTLPTKIDSESVIDNTPTLSPYPVPSQSTPPVTHHTLSATPLPLLSKKRRESLSSTTTTTANASTLLEQVSFSKQHRTSGLDTNGKQSRRISNPTIDTTSITSNTVGRNGSMGIKDQRRLTVRISTKKRGSSTKRSTHFLLGDCVGKGQFGSVYRALDMKTGEIVAVKRISVVDTKVEDDIMQEINLLRGMSCPHIVRYIGFAQDETYMNIVLEYVENGSLLSTLKAFGSLPEKLVGSYTYKILKGLEYLHEHDVVHCDLKAANILTTKTGDIKLTDFGVSLNMKIKQDGEGTPAGTPNWMAPEVIEMKGACYKSDIWSLACTITELLTGKPPYADLISMSALYHIVEDDCPPLPANISNNLQEFLLLCFQKDPVCRPTASELLIHPWLYAIRYDAAQPTSPMEAPQLPCLGNIDENNCVSTDNDGNKENGSLKTMVNGTVDQQHLRSNSMDDAYVDTDDDTDSQVTILTCENDFLDLIGKPVNHIFRKTRLENHITCEVCNQDGLYCAYICEVCAFVCHDACRTKAVLCFYSHKKKNGKLHKAKQNDGRKPAWISSVSPFGVTTFEPTMTSAVPTPQRPNFPKQPSGNGSNNNNNNKLPWYFGFRRKPQQPAEQKKITISNKPVYGILKAAKSVPLLRESQWKTRDEHSRASVHPQLGYCDDNEITYPSAISPSPPPTPANVNYRKKQRQTSSSLMPPPPRTAWKITSSSLNKLELQQKRRTKIQHTDKDCIIS